MPQVVVVVVVVVVKRNQLRAETAPFTPTPELQAVSPRLSVTAGGIRPRLRLVALMPVSQAEKEEFLFSISSNTFLTVHLCSLDS